MNTRQLSLIFCLCSCGILTRSAASHVEGSPSYSSVRLGLIGTAESGFPAALSESGRVGGYFGRNTPLPPFAVPVVWDSAGTPRQLPVVGEYAVGYVNGFLPDDTPVGLFGRVGQYPNGPVYWSVDNVVPLPDTGAGGNAITGNAEIVFGQTFTLTPGIGITRVSATIWDNEGLTVISGLAGIDSYAQSVNVGGTYLGATVDTSNPSDYEFGGFIGRDGTAVRLNFPGFTETRAFEINDDGWFTGVWEPAFATQRGYLARWDLDTGEREIHDLGIFPGYDETWAYAINNDRTVVGGAQHLGGDFDRALIWWQGSLTPQDLNLFVDIPEATLIDAYRINNAGQILAEARLHAGGYAYYVLTPVPEAGTSVVLLGASILAARRWRP